LRFDIAQMGNAGVNWNDMQALSASGINWGDIEQFR